MKYSKEQEFLLLAVRKSLAADKRRRQEELVSENLNWQYIQQQAYAHGVSSLLYDRCFCQSLLHPPYTPQGGNISQEDSENSPLEGDKGGVKNNLPPYVPLEVGQYFQDLYQQTYLRNTIIYQQFALILQEFQKHNIIPILLKGIMLAKWVYPKIALRPMQDIDVLLADQDIDIAAQVLKKQGYSNILRHLTYLSEWHRTHEKRLLDSLEHQGYHLPTFIKEFGTLKMCVELHHHLTPLMQTGDVDSVAIPDAEYNIRTLSPEYFLLHLCFHIYKHSQNNRMSRLIWYYDIAEFMKMYGVHIDWKRFLSICRQYQVEGEVLQSLFQTYNLLDVLLPRELALTGHTSQVPLHKLFPEKEPNTDLLFLQTVYESRKKEQVRYLWECLFPSKEFMVARYAIRHRWMVYFYYPLRLMKACVRGCKLAKDLVWEKYCVILSR